MWCRRSVLPSRHASPALVSFRLSVRGRAGTRASTACSQRRSGRKRSRAATTHANRWRPTCGAARPPRVASVRWSGRSEAGTNRAERTPSAASPLQHFWRARRGYQRVVVAEVVFPTCTRPPPPCPFVSSLFADSTARARCHSSKRRCPAHTSRGRLRASVPETPVAANAPPPGARLPLSGANRARHQPLALCPPQRSRSERACSLLLH